VWTLTRDSSGRRVQISSPEESHRDYDKFKVLGLEFDVNLGDMIKTNFENKIVAIQNLLKDWERRNLTPIGRITVIKSLALSKLVHLFTSLPNPSKNIVDKLNKIFFNFLWRSPVAKVKNL
jgi:hypothetical protein